MATSRGIWLGELAGIVGYDDVLKALTDIGSTVVEAQASILAFIAQQGQNGGSGAPVSVSFAALQGSPADNPALSTALANLASNIRAEIENGIGPAYEALQELQAQLAANPDQSGSILAALATRLRFDAEQILTNDQKTRAIVNLGISTRLLPTNATVGQALVFGTDGLWAPAFISAPSTTIDPLVTQGINISNQVSSAMRLRTISLGAE
jgi:hypothetical protein